MKICINGSIKNEAEDKVLLTFFKNCRRITVPVFWFFYSMQRGTLTLILLTVKNVYSVFIRNNSDLAKLPIPILVYFSF